MVLVQGSKYRTCENKSWWLSFVEISYGNPKKYQPKQNKNIEKMIEQKIIHILACV